MAYFYPRPPGGGRHYSILGICEQFVFLSTPSGWRATSYPAFIHKDFLRFLSTPSGWRATCPRISPKRRRHSFLSTPSGWRATAGSGVNSVVAFSISIHALRVEGDWAPGPGDNSGFDFYPRPPGGGRQQKRTKFSSVFAQKGEEIASLRRGKRKFAGGVLKRTNFGF